MRSLLSFPRKQSSTQQFQLSFNDTEILSGPVQKSVETEYRGKRLTTRRLKAALLSVLWHIYIQESFICLVAELSEDHFFYKAKKYLSILTMNKQLVQKQTVLRPRSFLAVHWSVSPHTLAWSDKIACTWGESYPTSLTCNGFIAAELRLNTGGVWVVIGMWTDCTLKGATRGVFIQVIIPLRVAFLSAGDTYVVWRRVAGGGRQYWCPSDLKITVHLPPVCKFAPILPDLFKIFGVLGVLVLRFENICRSSCSHWMVGSTQSPHSPWFFVFFGYHLSTKGDKVTSPSWEWMIWKEVKAQK